MSSSHLRAKWLIMMLAISLCTLFMVVPIVHADTDGTELQVTDQPEKLVIQLGPAWAGVEFELKTDAGLYPQPVVVSPEGILSMELGGSKTYTLSAMNSSTPPPNPDAPSAAEDPETETASPSPEQQPGTTDDMHERPDNPREPVSPAPEESSLVSGIPNMHLFLFAGGLIVCVGGLVIMRVLKKRRNNGDDDSDDDYDDYDD